MESETSRRRGARAQEAGVSGDEQPWIYGYIQDKGIDAFHKKYGYGLRSRVDAQISRIRRCNGATLLTQGDRVRQSRLRHQPLCPAATEFVTN